LADLEEHVFISYIEDLLAIDAVRWLDDLIKTPTIGFCSNSILAQCNAAIAGAGIVLLPTFVSAGVKDLIPVIPDKAVVKREFWISVRKEQASLSRIRLVLKFLAHVFEADRQFLLGQADSGARTR